LYPDRQQGIALRLTERNCRGGETESRQSDVCDYRRWQWAAHCRRRLHEDHGNAAAGRSVPWPGLGLSRRSVGTSRSLLRFHAVGAKLHQIWPGQGHRADAGYQGRQFHNALKKILPHLRTQIVKRSDQARGFVVLPKRSIVERTLAWLNRCRRLTKDWENLNRTALAFLRLASIRLMLRKLCNPH